MLISWLTLVTLTLNLQMANPSGTKSLAGCSAVYVGPTTALSAAHCFDTVRYTGKGWAKTSDGKSYEIELIAISRPKDLALIRIKGPAHTFATLGAEVERGDSIYTVNAGMRVPNTYNEGIVSNVVINTQQVNTLYILHTAAVRGGASGSGLFNKWGRLVGINTDSFGAFSGAVDTLPMRHFLEQSAKSEVAPKL